MTEKERYIKRLEKAAEEMVVKGEMKKLPNGSYKATGKMKKPTEKEWDELFDLQAPQS